MLIYGHRGAAGLAPENTLASIHAALNAGVDGVEVDVRCTRDGAVVLMHDATIDRTTPGSGALCAWSLEELRKLTADPAAGIATLAELLPQLGPHVLLNVEIKERAAVIPTADVVRAALQAGACHRQQLLASSFDVDCLRQLHRLAPEIPLGMLTLGPPPATFWNDALTLGATAANIDDKSVDHEFIDQAHQRKLQVMVCTVNAAARADQLREWGVDGVFTDVPNVVRRTD
jgi:glycerophosphoryl diester phosphodiesterase